MIPTVTQQLRTMRTRLEQTVVPALPADAAFAREQALLVLATLDWLVDTHEHEYRYQVVENHEYREAVAALAAETAGGNGDGDEVAGVLARPAPAPEAAAVPLAEVAEQNRLLKDLLARAHAAAAQDPGAREHAHDVVSGVARRQRERELAWYRMTGFPGAQPAVAEVLDAAAARGSRPPG